MTYDEFLDKKLQLSGNFGFEPVFMPDFLFDFQKHLVEWALKKGRAAIFADCGLGKSPIELVWAKNIVEKTGGNVLFLTPLAVTLQMQEEAEKFNINAKISRNGILNSKITITNYEQLHNFNSEDFKGIVCDESGILKNFEGKIKNEINIFMRKIPYRLLATATPSPNDFIELGTSSEALGYLGYMDMLSKFFKNDQNNCATSLRSRFVEGTKWRLKNHAHDIFWRWVTSWSRAIRTPKDLGFNDSMYILPNYIENWHNIKIIGRKDNTRLFTTSAKGLKEERDERRGSINERCEKVAEIVNNKKDFSVVWCNLNDEGDLLEKLIKDSVQVSGKDTDEKKQQKISDFSNGKTKCIIIKPKIGAWGLNWQHCNHMTYFPTHSFEQYYQAVRRLLRFGQKRKVEIDLIFTDGDENMIKNLKRKKQQAEEMFLNLVKEMNNSLNINRTKEYNKKMEAPKWL